MGKLVSVIVVLIILAAGAWAIFGRNSSTNNASSSNTNNQSSGTKPEAANAVSIEGFSFSPGNITVKKGTTVTWTNNDSVAHTITESDDKNGPDSSTVTPGGTYNFTYAQTGTFNYKCSIHPDMIGTVTVTNS